jgi:hypothetical protein
MTQVTTTAGAGRWRNVASWNRVDGDVTAHEEDEGQ